MSGLKLFARVAVVVLCFTGATSAQTRTSEVADAAQRGDRAAVQKLLRAKADVNIGQIDGATALHWAVYRGDVDLMDALIRAGANVKATNREGVAPLAMAALYGNVVMLDKLLKAGADANALGPAGETMLMFAARNGNPAVIKALVETGADVNAREPLRGTTALMWAAEQKHPKAVEVLLAAGADPMAKSGPAGLPRSHMADRLNVRAVEDARQRRLRAAAAGRTYAEQLEWERRNGAPTIDQGALAQPSGGDKQPSPQPDARDQRVGGGRQGGPRNQTPTQPQQSQSQSDVDDNADVVIAGLVGSGGGGLTALVFAAREGDIDSARLLIDGGADVNQQTNYGWTPLLTAVNNRNYRLAKLLIERGADVNIANRGGWTSLYLATDNRNIEGGDYPVPKPDMDHLDFVQLLLDKGANPNARVKDDTLTRTIFTMQWFREDGATPFVRAAQSSDLALMKLLLQHGADPRIKTVMGDTALTVAGGVGWVPGVTFERSPEENIEAIRLLLDAGLDPNAANVEGRTALMGAAMKGRNEAILLLVEHGADLAQQDNGSRDTDKATSAAAGHRWQAIDYADGLVRVGVQSAVEHPETSKLIRQLMEERGISTPPLKRDILSICVVALCADSR